MTYKNKKSTTYKCLKTYFLEDNCHFYIRRSLVVNIELFDIPLEMKSMIANKIVTQLANNSY